MRVVQQLVCRLAHQLLRAPTEHLGRGRVRERDAAALVDVVDALSRERQDPVVVALEALQLGLGELERRPPLADVLHDAEALERTPGVVADHRHGQRAPDDLAGLADVALVDAVAAQLAREHLPRQPEARVDVVRVGDVREGEPGELGRAVAGEPAEGGVRLGQAEVVADQRPSRPGCPRTRAGSARAPPSATPRGARARSRRGSRPRPLGRQPSRARTARSRRGTRCRHRAARAAPRSTRGGAAAARDGRRARRRAVPPAPRAVAGTGPPCAR